jgi:ABC-2 type transport system ATP-binding protein
MTNDQTTDAVVTVRGLHKRYGERTVVEGLDLDVGAGEIVGLIGANGAGKTTTVECIQGLRRADGGTVRVLGMDPWTDAARVRRLVGSQLQDASLPDRLRVGEAVDLFDVGRRGDGEALLEQFGLVALRRTAFASLSGGERQRLFLVLALLDRPRLVVLDELTQGLDPTGRRDVWAAVRGLADDGRSVLLVTHELEEVERLCDRVVAMRAGRVLDAGTPAELVTRHGGDTAIRFSHPNGHRALGLEAVDGVVAVGSVGDRVTVTGARSAIVPVGAALAARGVFPPDLSVEAPDLERSLLALLEPPDPADATEPARELVGARS